MKQTAGTPAGGLWRTIVERSREAIAAGVVQSIPTTSATVEQDGILFLVRTVEALMRKDAERAKGTAQMNPFLPYEEALFVADVPPAHVGLLNKFNVVDHHLLIITRAFEDQETLLTVADFEATWRCMDQFDALAFYNAGEIAGASQRHKHMQLVPLPLTSTGPPVPIESVLPAGEKPGRMVEVSCLGFRHAFTHLPPLTDDPQDVAAVLHTLYLAMLEAVGLARGRGRDGVARTRPYNLLLTRDWMLLVPRSAERYAGVSINALGFAGALLVRNEIQRATLERDGCLRALAAVGVASESPDTLDGHNDR